LISAASTPLTSFVQHADLALVLHHWTSVFSQHPPVVDTVIVLDVDLVQRPVSTHDYPVRLFGRSSFPFNMSRRLSCDSTRGPLKEVVQPREWLSTPSFASHYHLTMDSYELEFTIPSCGRSTAFMDFSPNGRFLAVGYQDIPLVSILDRFAGFHPDISTITPGKPTAVVWETSETFYAGLSDGSFLHYKINLKDNRLVGGSMNGSLCGEGFPITVMAIDVESRTLVVSAGPGVFAFRRIRETSKFLSLMDPGHMLTRLKANSASLHVSQPASISEEILELQPHLFRDPFASLPTTRLSSHSVSDT
jgi:hypothetical protein